MAQSTQLLITLILLLASAACAAAGGNPTTGVDAACSKTLYPDFCEMMLMPCAAEFADKDTKKMGYAAINATIERVQAFKSFMVSQGVKQTKSNELRAAIVECVDRIGRGEGSLHTAVSEFNFARGAAEATVPRKMGRADPAKMIDAASADLAGCLEALKKSEAAARKVTTGAGVSADISRQAMRSANETVLACSVAKSFVVMP